MIQQLSTIKSSLFGPMSVFCWNGKREKKLQTKKHLWQSLKHWTLVPLFLHGHRSKAVSAWTRWFPKQTVPLLAAFLSLFHDTFFNAFIEWISGHGTNSNLIGRKRERSEQITKTRSNFVANASLAYGPRSVGEVRLVHPELQHISLH